MFNLPLYIYFIGISLISSAVAFLQNGFPVYVKVFFPFLFISLFTECLGFYLWNAGRETYQLYNVFTVLEFCFYLFVIGKIVEKTRAKKIIYITLFAYMLIAGVNILFFQKNTFHSITYSLGCLLIVSVCIYYFFELFQAPRFINLVREPAFWISSGLLFYYSCSFPLLGVINFLNGIPDFLLKNMQTILTIMNILLYSLFTIAFLCRIRIRKYTLS
jgi:hypothetical protein